MQDFIAPLDRHQIRYALVGGFAVNYYGYVRATQEIDFLIAPSTDNAERMMQVLHDFGFGNAGIPRSAFERLGSAIHLGAKPNRIDLLTALAGVDVSAVLEQSFRLDYGGVAVRMVSLDDLLTAKHASSRAKDHADVEELERVHQHGDEQR